MLSRIICGVATILAVTTIGGCIIASEEKPIHEEMEEIPEEITYANDLYEFESVCTDPGNPGLQRITYLFPRETIYGLEGFVIRRKVIEASEPRQMMQGTKALPGRIWIFRSEWAIDPYLPDLPSFADKNAEAWREHTVIYDCQTENISRPTHSDISDILDYLTKLNSSLDKTKDEMLALFVSFNFPWIKVSPSGTYRIMSEIFYSAWGPRVAIDIKPKIIYPPELKNPRPLAWLKTPEDILILCDSDNQLISDVYITKVANDEAHTIVRAANIKSNIAISPDGRKVAVAFNEKILVFDYNQYFEGWQEIYMPYPANDPRGTYWTAFRPTIFFSPDSDLLCVSWPVETNTFASSPTLTYYIISWRSECMLELEKTKYLQLSGTDYHVPAAWVRE